MTEAAATDLLLRATMFAGLGMAGGLAFFAALRLNVDLYVSGRSMVLPAVLHLGRVGVLAVGMYLAVQHGALALLSALAGLLAARRLSLRRGR